MTGELALAMLLPGGVSFSLDEIHANVYVEFDDRAKALSSMEKIQAAVEDGGVEFSVVDVEGTDAVVMNLGDDQGPLNLTPGYVVLDDYVVIGTTLTSLRQAVEAGRGDIPSLRESSAFSRPLAAAGNSTDFMIYGNIRRIIKEVLDQLDETELEEYGKTAEPFVEPLEAFLLGVAVEEDIVTFTTVITFSAPTDAPTREPTAASTSAPTTAPASAPTTAPAPADEPEALVGTFGVGESVRVGDYLVELTDAYMEDEGTVSLEVDFQNAGGSPVPMPDWDTQMSLQDQDGYWYDRASASRNTTSDQRSPDATVNYSLTYPESTEGRPWGQSLKKP